MNDLRSNQLIDVLLPVRAPAPWFVEAIQSVVDQTIREWRIIVIMDGWSPEIQRICDNLNMEAQVDVAVLPARSGLVAALNKGLSLCNAAYVARLDADDVCHPERFERQVAYLRENPTCVAVGTGVTLISADGTVLGKRKPRKTGSVLRRLRWRNAIVHPSVMIRRSALEDAGGYSPSAPHAEDYELWLRLATIGDIHAISEQLLQYRIHDSQVTSLDRVTPETFRAIAASRRRLAQARGENELATTIRHWTQVSARRAKRALVR